MALYGGFAQDQHFAELSTPLPTQEGVLSASVRRARAVANIFGGSQGSITMPGPAAGGTGASAGGAWTFDAQEATIVVGDYLGRIDFKAGSEASGTDAILVGASIAAVAEDTFSATVNATSLVFMVGASEAAAEKLRITSTGAIKTAVSNGTPGTNVTAVEYGDAINHYTVLTCTAFAVGTGADNADLAIGATVYTFPAGIIIVEEASLVGIFDDTGHNTIADGEVGLGTVVGSTAVDTLGEVGTTSENILQGDLGVMSTYVMGTTVITAVDQAGLSTPPLYIAAASVHTVFLNMAATFPDIAAGEPVTFTGTITLKWRRVA